MWEYGCRMIYAGVPSFFCFGGLRTVVFQLSGFYCTPCPTLWSDGLTLVRARTPLMPRKGKATWILNPTEVPQTNRDLL